MALYITFGTYPHGMYITFGTYPHGIVHYFWHIPTWLEVSMCRELTYMTAVL